MPVFKVQFMDEALNFVDSLPPKVALKIYSNIMRVSSGEVNIELFKKLEGYDIWEFRTLFNKTAYRLFAFWDTESNTIVVATHGIIKKAQRTPIKEIHKADKMRINYFKSKHRQ